MSALVALALCAACASTGGIHARMGWSEQGLRVVDVPRTGPAWRAGLRPGDRIVSIDGKPVRSLSMRETVKRLRGPVGSSTKLKVQRDDSILHFEVKRAEYR